MTLTDQPLDHRRREVKMVLPVAHLHRVGIWLRTHESDFSPIFKPRWINNIYFDTEDFASVNEAVEGDSRRVKVRLRWYRELDRFTRGTLEFKCKVGSLGWKRGCPIAAPFELGKQSWHEITRMIRKAAPPEQRLIFEQASRPALINRYHRSYHLSFDRSTRITVDTHMCSWLQTAGLRPNLRRARPFHCHMVLEFKMPHDRSAVLADALRELEGRITKHSKYVTGMLGLSH